MAVPQFGNFSSCCRLCLSENTDSLKSVFDDATGDNALAQKILTFVAVEIQDGDKLSTLVCTSCIEKVNVWISFREYCTKNQVKLEERLSTWISIPEFNFQIKEEVLDDPLDEEIEIVNGDLIRVKSEPIDDEFVEMPSLVAESESQTNSSEGIFKKCRYCAKIFSNSLVRFRHEQRNHSNETEEIDDDATQNSSVSHDSIEEALPKELPEDPKKIQFAAGLELFTRDSTPISMESLSKIELSYIEKCKAMVSMYRSLNCACHNVKHPNLKGLLSHLRALRIWFPVFTCYHCMITFTDRSSNMRHIVKCPKLPLEAIIRLSSLRKRNSVKTRLYQNYKCAECKFMFSFHEDFCKHVDEDHSEGEPPFVCSCKKEFNTLEDYREHAYMSCLVLFYCDICFITTPTLDEFVKHASQLHDNSEGFILLQDDNYKKRTFSRVETSPGENIVVGKRRSSIYNKAPVLEPEVEIDTKPRLTVIPLGGSKATTCSECGKLYSTHANMLRHYRTHVTNAQQNGNSPNDAALYCCPDCGTMCNFQEWEIHKRTHDKKQCLECNKIFQFQSELEQHRSVHLNLKVYRDSKTKSYKSTMLSPNSDKANLICNICEATFATFDDFNEHKVCHEELLQIPKVEPPDEETENKYACLPCNKVYTGNSGLWDHNKRKHPDMKTPSQMYPKECEQCNKTFSTGAAFFKHKQIHLKDTPEFESISSASQSDTEMQEKPKAILKPRKSTSAAKDEAEDYHTCKRCFKVFSTKYNLRIHMKLHGIIMNPVRGTTKILKSPKKVWCESCHVAFDNTEKLQAHKEEEHDMPDLINVMEEFNSKAPFIFTCDVCVKTFSTKLALKKHKEKHASEAALKLNSVKTCHCKLCKITFETTDLLAAHMVSEHGEEPKVDKTKPKQFACTICKKVFLTSTALCAHQGWHKRGKVEKFRTQEKIFRKMVNNIPQPSPSSEFQCSTCQLELPNDTALQIHILEKHRNFNAFIIPRCSPCNQEFETQEEYENHKRLHELVENQKKNQKNFSCKYCTAAFSRSDTLATHVRQNHRDFLQTEYRCNQCDRTFDKQTSLTIHLKVHEKQKATTGATKPLFFCSICNMGFNLPKDLRTHTINAHPF